MPVTSGDLKNGQPVAPGASRWPLWKSESEAPPPPQRAPDPPQRPRRRGPDWSLVIGQLAGWVALAAFGGVWWVINGGFSVIGLGPAASGFGWIGNLGYAVVTSWTFRVGLPEAVVQALGIPRIQPVLPWVGSAAASVLQVVLTYRQHRKLKIPGGILIVGLLLSLYDLGTTWYGLGTTSWARQAGVAFQSVLAVILTFGLELLIGLLLRPGKEPT